MKELSQFNHENPLFEEEEYTGQALIRKEYYHALFKAFHFINHDKVEGDYLEFGVYKGWSLRQAYDISRKYNLHHLNLFGFDSFAGFPSVQDQSCEHFTQGKMVASRQDVEKRFSPGIFGHTVQLIEGFYADNLKPYLYDKYKLTKAAIINIDCDVYESAVSVFDFITPLLHPGTVIFLDDWYCYRALPKRGVQRAFNEWIEQYPH